MEGKAKKAQALGLVLVFSTAIIWVVSSFISESLVSGNPESGTGVVPPFLLTYLATTLFTLYLPLVHGRMLIMDWWQSRKDSRQQQYSQLATSDTHHHGGSHSPARSMQARERSLKDSPSKLEPHGRDKDRDRDREGGYRDFAAANRQAMEAALLATPLWLAAQYAFNASLALTSVTSNTILSSTASLFTFALSCVFLRERFTTRKLVCILATIAGTAMVTLSDAEAGASSGPGTPAVAPPPLLGLLSPASSMVAAAGALLLQPSASAAAAATGGASAVAGGGSGRGEEEAGAARARARLAVEVAASGPLDPTAVPRTGQLSSSSSSSASSSAFSGRRLLSEDPQLQHLARHLDLGRSGQPEQGRQQEHLHPAGQEHISATAGRDGSGGSSSTGNSLVSRSLGSGLSVGAPQPSPQPPPARSGRRAALGDGLVLLSGALYGAYTVAMRAKMPGEEEGAPVGLFFGYVGLLTTVCLAPVVAGMAGWGALRLGDIPRPVYGIILLEGLLDYVLADYLWARAVLLLGPTLATLSLSVQIPLAAGAEVVIGGRPEWSRHAGTTVLMLAGTGAILAGFFGANVGAEEAGGGPSSGPGSPVAGSGGGSSASGSGGSAGTGPSGVLGSSKVGALVRVVAGLRRAGLLPAWAAAALAERLPLCLDWESCKEKDSGSDDGLGEPGEGEEGCAGPGQEGGLEAGRASGLGLGLSGSRVSARGAGLHEPGASPARGGAAAAHGAGSAWGSTAAAPAHPQQAPMMAAPQQPHLGSSHSQGAPGAGACHASSSWSSNSSATGSHNSWSLARLLPTSSAAPHPGPPGSQPHASTAAVRLHGRVSGEDHGIALSPSARPSLEAEPAVGPRG